MLLWKREWKNKGRSWFAGLERREPAVITNHHNLFSGGYTCALMDNIMGRVETKERMRLWDGERKRARTLYYGNFLETPSDSWWWAGFGHACARRSDSLWNPEKLLEENWSKGKRGMESCQSNCPWHGTRQLRWLPCAIQLRMTMYLILLARQKRWGSRPRAQFQLPAEKKGKGQTNPTQKHGATPPPFFSFPSTLSTNNDDT